MKKAQDIDKFAASVKEEMERDNSYYGALCCKDCAMAAVDYLVENYPTYLTTVRGREDGTFRVSCWKIHKEETEE